MFDVQYAWYQCVLISVTEISVVWTAQPRPMSKCVCHRQKQEVGLEQMVVMTNKAPRWNEQVCTLLPLHA